jgi:hypothetical protein
MKRLISIASVLVAVCALSATATSSASAGCYRVEKPGAGNFLNDDCDKPTAVGRDWVEGTLVAPSVARGLWCAQIEAANQVNITKSFASKPKCINGEEEGLNTQEWVQVYAMTQFVPATSQKFTTTSGTSVLEAGGNTVTCSGDTSAGEITGAMSVGKIVVDFAGCKSTGSGGSNCTIKSTNTSTPGLIRTNTLRGLLGNTSEAKSGAGLDLAPEAGTTFVGLAETACTPATNVTGSIVGEVTPLETLQTTGKLIFSATGKKQVIQTFGDLAGEQEPELVAFAATATESTSESVTYTSKVEIT